ncbi:unnamed protein product [Lactuca virosa]|uniref:Uncharacterized protein n=1 Tax=Lactuca virosa TaxID=75947 RepID=A0AAU9LXJ0_9ASTR|nr:unnamed protein product [Lactuca virosa]
MSEDFVCLSGGNSTSNSSGVVESLPWALKRINDEELDSIKQISLINYSEIHILTLSNLNSEGRNVGTDESSMAGAKKEHCPVIFSIKPLTESKEGFTEITTPLNDGREGGSLGQHDNGLHKWAAIKYLGQYDFNQTMDLMFMIKEKLGPHVNKAIDISFWTENNHVYPNQLASPSLTLAMAYVLQQNRRVRSSSRMEW